MNIILRVDASSKIGVGHISRLLVYAKRFKKEDIVICYHKMPEVFLNQISKMGIRTFKLYSRKINYFIKVLKTLNPAKIVIDNYQIDYKKEKKIKKNFPKTKLTVFDDTYEKHFCDKLINPNIYADVKKYKNKLFKRCEIKAGREYVLLRDEFYEAKDIQKKQDYILVMLGGLDIKNLTIKILKLLKNQKLKVITTSANQNIKALLKFAKNHKNIEILKDCKNVAKVMKVAKFAIITPSVVANEASFLGTKFMAIKVANNQKYMQKYLKKQGVCALKKFNKKRVKKCLKTLQ